MVLNQAQGLKKKSHEVSARKNNNRLRYNKKCRGGRIPPPPALLELKTQYFNALGLKKLYTLCHCNNRLRLNQCWMFRAENMKCPLYLLLLMFRVFFRVLEKSGNP